MKAIILAGDEGVRLRPLTCKRPKALIPVMGSGVLEHIFNLLAEHNITDISVIARHLPEAVTDFLKSRYPGIKYFVQSKHLGTAGSIKAVGFGSEPFIAISGDIVTDFNITEFIKFHKQNNSKITLALVSAPKPKKLRALSVGGDSRIMRHENGLPLPDTVNAGIYIIEPEIMNRIPQGKPFGFSSDLLPALFEENFPMYGYVSKGFWHSISDIPSYLECQKNLLRLPSGVPVFASELEKGVFAGANTVIEKGVILHPPVYIGSETRICSGSIIGPDTVIGSGCFIQNNVKAVKSCIWDGCRIENNSDIDGCVVCENVHIGANCRLLSGCAVGDDCLINKKTIICNNIKLWNNKETAEGAVISENIITGSERQPDSEISKPQLSEYVTPEQLLRLTASFATVCGGKIAVATDCLAAASAGKNAAMAGIAVTGCQCMDFGVQPLPATRMGIRFYGLSGGVHIISDDNKKGLRAVFISKTGVEIDAGIKKRVAQLYETGEYNQSDTIKESVPLGSYKYYYLRDAINRCHSQSLKFNILLNVKNPTIQGLLTSALKELGCSYKLDCDVLDFGENGKSFGEKVKNGRFDMGIYINSIGEKFVLFDKNGVMINNDITECMFAAIVFKSMPAATYFARISAPDAIDALARQFGGRVKRTENSEFEVMHSLTEEADIPLQFILEFDAVGGFIKTLDFLSLKEMSLEKLLMQIPDFYLCRSKLDCKIENDEKIIKEISGKSNSSDLTHGIKIRMEKGWVLIIPHADRNSCEIICEGENEEYAEELAADYKKLLKDITKLSCPPLP